MSKLTVVFWDFCKFFQSPYVQERLFHSRFIQRLNVLAFLKSIIMPSGGDPNTAACNRIDRYWSGKSAEDVIKDADLLFSNSKYLEVYELLNKVRYYNNIEVQWRLARALFKLSCEQRLAESARREMVQEAYDVLNAALPAGENCAQLHKWAAIILDRKNGMDGLDVRVRNAHKVKGHLIKCCELDPNDITSQYLLGRWCYEMSNITWFQRILARLLYGDPPRSTLEEAQGYLAHVEELQPKLFLRNTFLLGKTCMKMGHYYKAKYYFGIAAGMQPNGDYERDCALESRKLLKKLDKYSCEKDALFYECPFGNDK